MPSKVNSTGTSTIYVILKFINSSSLISQVVDMKHSKVFEI